MRTSPGGRKKPGNALLLLRPRRFHAAQVQARRRGPLPHPPRARVAARPADTIHSSIFTFLRLGKFREVNGLRRFPARIHLRIPFRRMQVALAQGGQVQSAIWRLARWSRISCRARPIRPPRQPVAAPGRRPEPIPPREGDLHGPTRSISWRWFRSRPPSRRSANPEAPVGKQPRRPRG